MRFLLLLRAVKPPKADRFSMKTHRGASLLAAPLSFLDEAGVCFRLLERLHIWTSLPWDIFLSVGIWARLPTSFPNPHRYIKAVRPVSYKVDSTNCRRLFKLSP